jgi:uncharacterized membrane protein YoaK (UPF0700 family)
MTAVFTKIRQVVWPDTETRHGPLQSLLIVMTFVTGLVDAFSYLVLGHVLVANMTGNVLFLGFALAGAPGFSIGASLVALASFWIGALLGGRVGAHFAAHRGRLFNTAASIQVVLLAVGLALAALSTSPMTGGFRYPLIVVLGIAMGNQTAAARRLAVPDLPTTVLTLTITGTAADSWIAGGGSAAARRFITVGAMLVGGLIGAAFVIGVHDAYPLALALIVVGAVAATTRPLRRSERPWVRA